MSNWQALYERYRVLFLQVSTQKRSQADIEELGSVLSQLERLRPGEVRRRDQQEISTADDKAKLATEIERLERPEERSAIEAELEQIAAEIAAHATSADPIAVRIDAWRELIAHYAILAARLVIQSHDRP
jgi:hypothetical protein